jgi:HAE1 family hydrophobic/amphiphilic exporter-1
MTLTELAIKRPSIIVVIFAVLGVLGIFGYSQLNYELLPKFSPPVVVITTIYPGASPSEVENNVTRPIEDAVSGLDKVASIIATSQEGFSLVTIEFQQSAKIDIALQDAQRKVNQMASTLPESAKQPTLLKIALDEIPVLRMGVTSSMPPREFYQFLENQVQPRLSNVAGVAQITLIGGDQREIKVNIDAEKARSYGLSIARIAGSIRASNVDFPTGKVKDAESQFTVRVAGKFTSIDELRNLVVGQSRAGGDILLKDVAEVEDGRKDYTTISRVNGVTSVGLLVQKQSDANAVTVSQLVRKELTKMQEEYKATGINFDIAQDGSLFTVDAADAVKHDLMMAVILVAAVMFLFLHSFRNSLIVMVAIPASLVSTFFIMYLMGFTLNLMTLLALSLVIGILVDDSIVVLENIYHHMEKGEEPRSAALTGRNEIGFAALSITLVDVVVFLPISFVSGLIGNIMREFALVVVFATLMSLFVSFTITPLLASRFSKVEHMTKDTLMGRFALWFERGYEWFKRQYLQLLNWSLHHRWQVMVITAILFFGSFTLFPLGFIGAEFMTQSDRGEFAVTMELPPGVTLEKTNEVTQRAERIITQMPEVRKAFVNVGASSDGFIGTGGANNISELNVSLVPAIERVKTTDDIGYEIKQKLLAIPGVKVRVSPIGIFGGANQAPIQIVVNGTNQDDIRKGANHVAELLRQTKGTTDVRLSSEEGKPETRVEIDREKMASLGLTIADVGTTLSIALTGDDQSKYREGQDEYDIRIALDEFNRSSPEDLRSLTFTNPMGQAIELGQFANIYQASGPTKLQRQNRQSSITVFSQVLGRPSGTIIEEFKQKLEKSPMPAGTNLTYMGDAKNQAEGFGSLGIAFMGGILFVYLIMVALYDSYIYPFVVLFSIPVAMIGAFLALALAMKTMNIFTILGLIMLCGLVAKNAILIVDRANDMKLHGMNSFDALMEAGASRLRPILMTTLAMVIGMLPIALASGAGAEWKTGLAWAIIGGLTSSMLLTLVFVPVIYIKVDQWKDQIPAFYRRVFKKGEKSKGARAFNSPEPALKSGPSH